MAQFRSENGVLAEKTLPEEMPIALSIGGSTHAVMLATPRDLEDFAYGLAYSEGVIEFVSDVELLDIERFPEGIDLQMQLTPHLAGEYRARKRQIAGPVGCGLCGVESLALALPDLMPVSYQSEVSADFPARAMRELSAGQKLGAELGAMHGAALFSEDCTLFDVREDVGRHNALDKVIGAALRAGRSGKHMSVAISSRISVELVQKSARFGASCIMGAARPTTLAVQRAKELNIKLIAPIRGGTYWELVE